MRRFTGNDIVDEARRWIGTPYVHQASVAGQGADCLGLLRGLWRTFIGPEPADLPPYTADWGEASHRETMLETANLYFETIPLENALPGDVLIFRWNGMFVAKHAGVLSSVDHFIHAYEKAGVVENSLCRQWRQRIVKAFRFPQPKAA